MPPKTRSFTVDFALYGIGRMEFDDVTVVPVTLSNLMDVLNFPCGCFDKLFCLGEGQVLPMLFALGCPGTPDGNNLRLELELPQGFKVVSWRREHPLLARKENTYTFDLSKLPPSVTAPGFNRQWGAVALPVQSSLKPSPQTFTARCRTRGAMRDTTGRWPKPTASSPGMKTCGTRGGTSLLPSPSLPSRPSRRQDRFARVHAEHLVHRAVIE